VALESIRLGRHSRLQAAAGNNPAMRIGESGEAVEMLQQALIDLGIAMPLSTRKTGFADGIFGVETASAVRSFQARERLQQDGIAGQETLRRLDEILLQLQTADHARYQAELMLPPPYRKFHAS
jgi:peptidoglycan hydrolase-like protein with peptidoglycan-binding domain